MNPTSTLMERTLVWTLLFAPLFVLGQHESPLPCLAGDLSHIAPYVPGPAEVAQMAMDDAELELFTQDYIAEMAEGEREPYIISVVFHIIHNHGPENISNAQVHDAMRVLNDDFNKLNTDWQNVRPEFLDIVADVDVEFRLARKDPQGNCTNGITRTVSTLTNQGDQAMKNLIQWPRNRYLNVWVCAYANGAAGYTYRPGPVNNQPTWDGIVLKHDYTGSIGTSSPFRSRTLTHEVGHWINLAHTWGNSNEPGLTSNCSMDDSVADTPNTQGWTTCNLNGSTCDGSLDNVENYMDYSYCSKMFTNGQADRMIAALNAGTAQRNQLWQPATLALTGVLLEDVLCAAQFTSNTTLVCAGSTIDFQDLSYNAVQSWNWSFPGGEPATSTEQNPSVFYAEPGVFPVTLVASDGTNEVSVTQASYLTILPNPGADTPYEEGFEALTDLASSPWTVVNPNNDATFAVTTAAAYSGGKSVRIQNTAAMAGRTDQLISEPINAVGASELIITYRYAYAQRNSTSDDRLRVFVSNNCGASWSLRQQMRGTQTLNTVGSPVSGAFVPNGPGQWAQAQVNNISPTYHVGDFRMRFDFDSDGGNYLYLDDININGLPLEVSALQPEETGLLALVPNPTNTQATAIVHTTMAAPASLELLDITGRRILVLHNGTLAPGTHRITVPADDLAPGAYLVRFIQGGDQAVVRLLKH